MLQNRPPVIVVLGHVDHGKTSLLDYLKKSNIAAREAGGITQHVRSFQLETKDYGLMTFIDTPGHEAFTKIRERGSKIADLAILVVAADDGVKPQTIESIEFIKNSHLPFIVAINKSDIPAADPDRVKTQLTQSDVVVEDFGGDVPVSVISAKTGKNVPELLELIHLVTSLDPPQADPQGSMELVVLESHLDSKKGPLATILVKNGTLKTGQELFQTEKIGKAKALFNFEGKSLTAALPSRPVEILGLNLTPEVGSVISDKPISPPSAFQKPKSEAAPSEKKINLILKADVAGSLEAIVANLPPEIEVIASGTGDINENEILLADTSKSLVIGFNLKLSGSIIKLAETEKVTLKTFPVIYELFDYLNDLLHPEVTEKIKGTATVLADFKINSDRIAGCRCTEGVFTKSDTVRVERTGQVIGTSRIKSLKISKNDVQSVKSGIEFGAVLSPYVDFKIGDAIIAIG
jgi:translation initiation factor IF-2